MFVIPFQLCREGLKLSPPSQLKSSSGQLGAIAGMLTDPFSFIAEHYE